jgi:hypothetical protein
MLKLLAVTAITLEIIMLKSISSNTNNLNQLCGETTMPTNNLNQLCGETTMPMLQSTSTSAVYVSWTLQRLARQLSNMKRKYATIVSGVIPQHDINFTAICKDFLPFLCWFGEKDFTGLSSGSNVFMSSKS